MAGFNDLATKNPLLAKEWHPAKNGALTPQEIGSGSAKKVWWQCDQGHEWQASVVTRSRGTGCPYCHNRKVLKGFNDLATVHPELAKEWHPTKNGLLLPEGILAAGVQRIHWQCKKGHEWEATVVSRANGTGCPVCSGKKVVTGVNDLATFSPRLAKQWHPTKNGTLIPQAVLIGSTKSVWWRCEKGHEWKARVRDRLKNTSHSDCRFCMNREVLIGFNDLATTHPELAKEWHPTKNGTLTSRDVMAGGKRKVWWLGKCGHEWEGFLTNRTQKKAGCPYCSNRKVLAGFNDLETTHPELSKEWHPTLNDGLTPQQVIRGSLRKVWWECRNGHVWKAGIVYRAGDLAGKRLGTGCPVCAKTRIG